jgi:beta-glucosidase/6-phospho-beta-glucosidase/beta-galactosidase
MPSAACTSPELERTASRMDWQAREPFDGRGAPGDLPAATAPAVRAALEMWGGVECTVVRVGDRYLDQTVLSGHQHRLSDLDAFAGLGITALRYPVLWERVAPDGPERADWRWTDERLARLRALGIRPIAGLVHHGSGPLDTGLAEPDFAPRLAEYAGAVARRYPWLDHYTPVNEPLTTARFSGLYGHWYPHARDNRAFLRMLVNQVNATRLAMRAIRAVNPAAKLVQTEDLGRVLATPRLAYQAEYENTRRWLGFDLLTGRFGPDHPMWREVLAAVPQREVDAILADPCPPDIIGINTYLSGERFLDERLDRYPGVPAGGNGRDRYVDVLALRAVGHGVAGIEALLEECWDRYRLPVAVTEVHNGSSRDEQLRWLKGAWDAAQRLRARGADIRAITAWSLLGATDWNSLLTRWEGHYEPGGLRRQLRHAAPDCARRHDPRPGRHGRGRPSRPRRPRLVGEGGAPGLGPGRALPDHAAAADHPALRPAGRAAAAARHRRRRRAGRRHRAALRAARSAASRPAARRARRRRCRRGARRDRPGAALGGGERSRLLPRGWRRG